jgi:hypothetical protein
MKNGGPSAHSSQRAPPRKKIANLWGLQMCSPIASRCRINRDRLREGCKSRRRRMNFFSTRGADELMGERLRLNTENTENTGPHIC